MAVVADEAAIVQRHAGTGDDHRIDAAPLLQEILEDGLETSVFGAAIGAVMRKLDGCIARLQHVPDTHMRAADIGSDEADGNGDIGRGRGVSGTRNRSHIQSFGPSERPMPSASRGLFRSW
ncbi:hypothetical protein KOJCDNHJ_04072 [Xanthomonas citri pv. punicae]|nr:hypothetical protein KOJCDNHJ_04072 [Xanthomonas citri pv. punicae]